MGIICPPPVGIGLTDLPNIGRGDRGTPSPHPTPVPVSLTLSMCAFGAFLDWVFGSTYFEIISDKSDRCQTILFFLHIHEMYIFF